MMSSIRSAAGAWACLAALCAGTAQAQQPAAAPPAAAVEVPAMACPTPGPLPSDKTSPAMGRFQKKIDEYKVCVNEYAKANGAKSSEYAAQARAYGDAANKAIEDYNTYITSLNEAAKASK